MQKVISLGLGVQSTALYYMSSKGILPRADYAVFSDLGREGTKTYQYLKYLQAWQKANDGIEIVVRNERNLYTDLLNVNEDGQSRFSSIPAYTENGDGSEGMLRRQCTGEYKIQVVDNCIRDRYGLKSGDRRPLTEVWHGITMDEMGRMSIPMEAWKVNTYPFIGYAATSKLKGYKIDWAIRKTRGEVIQWYHENGLPVPPKSSCIFCPYQSDYSWHRMKTADPEDFADAVRVDKAIRNSTKKGGKQPVYLHRSMKPLDQINFNPTLEIDWGDCSGNCHV
ncbi:hypothetical protein [Dyadobacter sp. LHD-138]|uniref:hypothetical protein n=1 Tax=Dyadobacter sp. LHD-138 TaxID=3071413 RepID=UPI0027DEC89C|nr:hypothetical protein [Dyadobacter sp. LHD-138]MDQ6479826.1 hypothetical protein [Dyadobacter sp. LHD-138]